MSDTTELETDAMVDPMTGEIIDEKKLAQQLLEQSREQSVGLVGPGGLLSGLTKTVLETALEAELTEHLGHEHGQPPLGSNIRNGARVNTVLTEIGPVEIDVPRDRDGSFEPVIVPMRKRRLDGIDEIVLSLTARGLTTGERWRLPRFPRVTQRNSPPGLSLSRSKWGRARLGRAGVSACWRRRFSGWQSVPQNRWRGLRVVGVNGFQRDCQRNGVTGPTRRAMRLAGRTSSDRDDRVHGDSD